MAKYDRPFDMIPWLIEVLLTTGGRYGVGQIRSMEVPLVAEVADYLYHLPFDTVLIPFLKKLGLPTDAQAAGDVKNFACWDPMALNPNGKTWLERKTVQPDLVVDLSDVLVLIEFKRVSMRPSDNAIDPVQVSNQVFYGFNRVEDRKNPYFLLVCNTAPKVHLKNYGLMDPVEAARMCIEKTLSYVKDLPVHPKEFYIDSLKDRINCITWKRFRDVALGCIDAALSDSTIGEGLRDLHERARRNLQFAIDSRFEALRRDR